jgi:hypothetical protein
MIPSGLTSTSSCGTGANRMSAAAWGKGVEESPWNERVQSTCVVGSSRFDVRISGSGGPGESARPWVEGSEIGD